MSNVGLDWYKKEPAAYLQDVQGLNSKEHAVYSVLIDLLYANGGSIRNDPKWISGWISDMGAASVRNTLVNLESNPNIKINVTKTEITQKRAQNEAKTKRKLRENAEKTGRFGGVLSAELRSQASKNNNLGQGYPSKQFQPDKIRLDKSNDDDSARGSLTDREVVLLAMGFDKSGLNGRGQMAGSPSDMLIYAQWVNDLGLSLDEIEAVIKPISEKIKTQGKPPPVSFKYYNNPMQEFAGQKAVPKLTKVNGKTKGSRNEQTSKSAERVNAFVRGARGSS